jgi:hypothetical protein
MACATPLPVFACLEARYLQMRAMKRIAEADSTANGYSAYLGITLSVADMEWR